LFPKDENFSLAVSRAYRIPLLPPVFKNITKVLVSRGTTLENVVGKALVLHANAARIASGFSGVRAQFVKESTRKSSPSIFLA
jgi:hypothetical protein